MVYLILFGVLLLFFLANRLYLKAITVVSVVPGSQSTFVPVKPNRSWFRSVSLGRSSSFVSLGCGYYALFFASDPADSFVNYKQIRFDSECYIIKRSRFGRFRSVDVSDRCLFDILSKFNEV